MFTIFGTQSAVLDGVAACGVCWGMEQAWSLVGSSGGDGGGSGSSSVAEGSPWGRSPLRPMLAPGGAVAWTGSLLILTPSYIVWRWPAWLCRLYGMLRDYFLTAAKASLYSPNASAELASIDGSNGKNPKSARGIFPALVLPVGGLCLTHRPIPPRPTQPHSTPPTHPCSQTQSYHDAPRCLPARTAHHAHAHACARASIPSMCSSAAPFHDPIPHTRVLGDQNLHVKESFCAHPNVWPGATGAG